MIDTNKKEQHHSGIRVICYDCGFQTAMVFDGQMKMWDIPENWEVVDLLYDKDVNGVFCPKCIGKKESQAEMIELKDVRYKTKYFDLKSRMADMLDIKKKRSVSNILGTLERLVKDAEHEKSRSDYYGQHLISLRKRLHRVLGFDPGAEVSDDVVVTHVDRMTGSLKFLRSELQRVLGYVVGLERPKDEDMIKEVERLKQKEEKKNTDQINKYRDFTAAVRQALGIPKGTLMKNKELVKRIRNLRELYEKLIDAGVLQVQE